MGDRSGAPSRGALERCGGDPGAFLRGVWARRARLHHEGGGFGDLLSFEDVDHLLSSSALRTPAFRLVKDGKPLPASSVTRSARISSVPMTGLADPVRIFREFDEGATIVLQGMHRYWPRLALFCRELELSLGHPCQANAYITPPGSKGLAIHEDSHDVFVLQAFGRKHWEVHAAPAEVANGGRRPLDAILKPGDALYMPKGTPHAARTQDVLSGHLTIGVLATTWRRLVDDAVARLTAEAGSSLDESIPAGYHHDPRAFGRAVQERLADVARRLDKLDGDELADAAIDRFLTSRQPIVPGGLVDLVRARELGDDTVVRRRPGSVCELRPGVDRLVVLLGDRELRMPEWLEPAMRWIARRTPDEDLRARDLADELDLEGRTVLVRRLVREGLLETVGEAVADGR
jgi:bifunctional lysine-specific demethylase and histidyl-hydroxylase NO66